MNRAPSVNGDPEEEEGEGDGEGEGEEVPIASPATFRSFSAPSRRPPQSGTATPLKGTSRPANGQGGGNAVAPGDDDTEAPEVTVEREEEQRRRRRHPYRSKSSHSTWGRRSKSGNSYLMDDYNHGATRPAQGPDLEGGDHYAHAQEEAHEGSPLLLHVRTTTPGGTKGLPWFDPYADPYGDGFEGGPRSGLATPHSYLAHEGLIAGGLPYYHPAFHEALGNNPYLWTGDEEGEDDSGDEEESGWQRRTRPLPLPPSTPASFSSTAGFPLRRQWGYGNISPQGLKILDVPAWNRAPVSRYQLLPGSSVFLCGGNILMSASDAKFFLLTLFLLLAPLLCFLYAEFQFAGWWWGIYVPVIICLLAIYTTAAACITAFSDPGILLRSPFSITLTDDETPEPHFRTVSFRRSNLSQRFCWTCGIWRPLRAVHCRSCDHCVGKH